MNTSTPSTTKPMIDNHDRLAIKSYITGADHTQYNTLDRDIVVLDLTHSNLIQQHIEIRFYKYDTIEKLRLIIHQKSGTSSQYQYLQVYDISGDIIVEIPDNANEFDTYKLGYFGIVQHGMRIHCIDMNPCSISAGGGLEDTSLITKFKMTDEQYDAKTSNTLRSWAKEQKKKSPHFTYERYAKQHANFMKAKRAYKLGLTLPVGYIYDPTIDDIIELPPEIQLDEYGNNIINNDNDTNNNSIIEMELLNKYTIETIQYITINSRCEITPGKRRGRIGWKGLIHKDNTLGMPNGYWVGIVLDEPVGKNNGTIDTIHYFDTPGDKYGVFVRGPNVDIGDYPERNILSDSDDDEEEI